MGRERGLTVHAAEATLEVIGPWRAEIESHSTGKHARIDSEGRKVRVRKLAEDITWHEAEDAEVRVLCLASCLSHSLSYRIKGGEGEGVLLTKLDVFVDPIDGKLRSGVGAHAWMDGAASCGGHCNDSPHAAKMLDEIVNHKMGSFDVCFLRID